MRERGSACSSHSIKKEDDSSQSSTCAVDTTTQGCPEETTWRGLHLSCFGGRAGQHGASGVWPESSLLSGTLTEKDP